LLLSELSHALQHVFCDGLIKIYGHLLTPAASWIVQWPVKQCLCHAATRELSLVHAAMDSVLSIVLKQLYVLRDLV